MSSGTNACSHAIALAVVLKAINYAGAQQMHPAKSLLSCWLGRSAPLTPFEMTLRSKMIFDKALHVDHAGPRGEGDTC